MLATLKDVARRAGVSITTASRILSGSERANEFSEETRRQVLKAAEALNYRPNPSARSLRTGEWRHQIAYVFYSRKDRLSSQPFYVKVLEGVEREAIQNEFDVLYVSLDDVREIRSMIERASRGSIQGLVLAGYFPIELADTIAEHDIPAVVVTPFHPVRLPRISLDNRYGVSLIIDHLTQLGHERIGFVSGNDGIVELPPFISRRTAFVEMLEQRGLPNDDNVCIIPAFSSLVKERHQPPPAVVEEILSLAKRCTAIVGANDHLAGWILDLLQVHGIKVPDDCSLAGFDGIDWVSYLNPPLTSIAAPMEEMGKKAVSLLLKRIGQQVRSVDEVVFRPSLVVRQSTGPPTR